MNQWTTFFEQYGMTILCTVLTAIAGTIGAQLKRLIEKNLTDKTKRSIVLSCVKAVEQLYGTLGGEEKKRKATQYISHLLNEKHLTVSPLELELLIESAVAEFKRAE